MTERTIENNGQNVYVAPSVRQVTLVNRHVLCGSGNNDSNTTEMDNEDVLE